jgi:hypothetical protein
MRTRKLQWFGLLVCTPWLAQATLIAYDGFEAGDFSGGTGAWASSGWSVDANTTVINKTMSYSSGTVSLSGGTSAVQYLAVDAGSNNSPWLARAATSTGFPVYYSFLIESSTADGDDDFLGSYPTRTGVTHESANDYGMVMRLNGGSARFGVRSGNGSGQNFVTSVDAPNNSTHLVVLKMEDVAGNNRFTLWVDPDSTNENGASNLSRSSVMGGGTAFGGVNAIFDEINFRTALLEAGDTYFVDEVRIGTSFSSVVIPEPGSALLMVLGTLILRLRKSISNA